MRINTQNLKDIYHTSFSKLREDLSALRSSDLKTAVMLKNIEIDFDNLDNSFQTLYKNVLYKENGGIN